MKYELETIPVWDALHRDGECFLCELMKEAEQHAVSYFLGSSVMHPETRVAVNNTGFCPHHWHALMQAQKPQSLALISHTFLQTTLKHLGKDMESLALERPGKASEKKSQKIIAQVDKRESSCMICRKMEGRLDRYLYTVVKLWEKDGDFRNSLYTSKGVCLHHMQLLLHLTPKVLKKEDAHVFSAKLVELVQRNLNRLESEVVWMTQKYKAEHKDAPWNGCEDAHKRLVKKLIGEGRIVCPS